MACAAARLVSLWSDEQKALAAQCDADVKRLTQERTDAYEQLAHEVRERGMEGLDESLKQQLREAFKTPVAKRSAEQKHCWSSIPSEYPVATFLERNAPKEYKAITDRFAHRCSKRLKSVARPRIFAHCLTEIPGRVSPTFCFIAAISISRNKRSNRANWPCCVRPAGARLRRTTLSCRPRDDAWHMLGI